MKKSEKKEKVPTIHNFFNEKKATNSLLTKIRKSRFPSIDGTFSQKSLSNFFLDHENSPYLNTENTPIVNTKTKYTKFLKKKNISISPILNEAINTNAAYLKEDDVSRMNMKFNENCDFKQKNFDKQKLFSPKKLPKTYKKTLKINLDDFSSKKYTKINFPSNDFLNTQPSSSIAPKVPDHIFENKLKIILAIHMKEPLLALECDIMKKQIKFYLFFRSLRKYGSSNSNRKSLLFMRYH